jgi:protein dithiol:quinone oxidoreductase
MHNQFVSRRTANALGLLACAWLIAYALYAQYHLHLEPCPLCLFQRFTVFGLAAVFLLALAHRPERTGARAYALLVLVVAGAGVAISARHIWIQFQPAGSVPSCGPSLGYLFDIMPAFDVVKKVFSGSGECARIDWTLLGLSMPWWTAFAMAALGAWGVLANWRFRRV